MPKLKIDYNRFKIRNPQSKIRNDQLALIASTGCIRRTFNAG